jgi:hypothetical protein
MRHEIYADDVENEISEEQRKCKIAEKPSTDIEHRVQDIEQEPTSNRGELATNRR